MPMINKQSNAPARNGVRGSKVLDRILPIHFDDEGIKMLLYGASGTGKTTLWATFPGPTLAVICSGGKRPGELRSINTPENVRKIKAVTLQTSGELSEIVEHLWTGTYKTVVLDHASGLSDLILKEILGLQELPAQLGWGTASQQQYGQLALQCKERFRELLSLPINVVIVAQERTFGGRDDGVDPEIIKPTVGAALTPSVTGWLGPACDYVAQTFKAPKMVERVSRVGKEEIKTTERGKGVEYCLRVGPHDVFQTKFRVPGGVKQDVIINPTYAKIMQLIRGS